MYKVHILATCRKPELAHMTRLVFKTLRIGFPTSTVTVHLNRDCKKNCPEIVEDCERNGCFTLDCEIIHHSWIERLVYSQPEPFFILDTDVILYESVENWKFDTALAGARIPEWQDEFSKCLTRSRLHTSLLFINPAKVREQIESFKASVPDTEFTPTVNLFNPLILAVDGKPQFYDTCSLLYHAIGGQHFSTTQRDAYFHFNFGTIEDMVLPTLSDEQAMSAQRKQVLENHDLGRGAWRQGDEYYASRQQVVDGFVKTSPPTPSESEEYKKVNHALCCGNRDAMMFCDLWYNYCHGIDDLIDTMQDGRPKLTKEQTISLFFQAALLYNTTFFVRHQATLFPIVLQITNTYSDSVAWENSPKKHLRVMGDVFRTCGNEMYFMVALICGGEAHMRKFSQFIKERDWLGQHDEHGNPT